MLAASAIESSNIVGYQQTEMKNSTGYNFIIPTFQDVGAGTATYKLGNIKLVGGYGDGMTDMIIGYDEYACLSGNDYYWSTPDDGNTTVEGWVNELMGDDTALVTDVTLKLGTGLYLNLNTDGAKVQYAGQVMQDSYETPALSSGYNMIGNSTPVSLDLQKIKLVDAYGDGMTDMIIGYDEFACLNGEDYYWSDTVDGNTSVDGWVNELMGDDTALVSGVTLRPGEGVYLNVNTDGLKVKIPSIK